MTCTSVYMYVFSVHSHNVVSTDHSVEPKWMIIIPMVLAKVKLCTRTSVKMICADSGRKDTSCVRGRKK